MCRMLTREEFEEECENPKFCAICTIIRDDVDVVDNICGDCGG